METNRITSFGNLNIIDVNFQDQQKRVMIEVSEILDTGSGGYELCQKCFETGEKSEVISEFDRCYETISDKQRSGFPFPCSSLISKLLPSDVSDD